MSNWFTTTIIKIETVKTNTSPGSKFNIEVEFHVQTGFSREI